MNIKRYEHTNFSKAIPLWIGFLFMIYFPQSCTM